MRKSIRTSSIYSHSSPTVMRVLVDGIFAYLLSKDVSMPLDRAVLHQLKPLTSRVDLRHAFKVDTYRSFGYRVYYFYMD